MFEATPSVPGEGQPLDAGGPAVPAYGEVVRGPLDDPRALQILSTEHWSLLTARSLAYNEAFSRAGMFLSFLSASLIVIGFLVGAQGPSANVIPVAIVLLLADLYIGLATMGRLFNASAEELHALRGMNRIRHAYRELVPGIERYFVSSFHDDARGVLSTYGTPPVSGDSPLRNLLHGLTTTIGMVGTIVAMLVGALAGLTAGWLAFPQALCLGLAAMAFLSAFVMFAMLGIRFALRFQDQVESRFPSPPEG